MPLIKTKIWSTIRWQLSEVVENPYAHVNNFGKYNLNVNFIKVQKFGSSYLLSKRLHVDKETSCRYNIEILYYK